MLYNNYVLNLEKFAEDHPGSSELLTRNLGCNVALVMEGYSSTANIYHKHSNVAYEILRRSIEGKMIENYQI